MQQAARETLELLTGQRMAPERWSAWLAAERAWFEEEGPNLLATLKGDEAAAKLLAELKQRGHPESASL